MHPQFLDLLRCPRTQAPLSLEIVATCANGLVTMGALLAPNGTRFPIVRGIPRFVGAERYSASFGYEWARWPRVQFEAENVGRPMAGHTTRMWETITAGDGHDLHGQTIVEFGCGPGRFLDVVRRKRGRAVGIDLSMAVESARQNFADDPDVLIVQGDVLSPPFRRQVFDGGYSIGVLHHTPDPEAGVRSLVRTVKANGWVACCVYPKNGPYAYRSVERMRRCHARLQPRLGYYPALAYAYLAVYGLAPGLAVVRRIPGLARLDDHILRNWLAVVRLPDRRWSVLDTFDAITPAIASTHTGDEVRAWMSAAGCVDLRTTAWGETAVVGVRA